MADVFLSYAQEDRACARMLADALRKRGWDVWWDAHVYVGTRFRAEITRQLQSAKCVVVLWSRASIESDWVIDEAEAGKKRGALVQAVIDAEEPPFGFRGIQWANLNSWSGDIHAEEFIKLADGISRFAGASTSIPSHAVQSPPQDSPAHIALDAREQTPTAQPRLLRLPASVLAKRWPLVFAGVGVVIIAAASMLYVAGLPTERPPQMAQLTSDKPVAASSSSAAPADNTASNANGGNQSAAQGDRATSAERPSSPPASPAIASAPSARPRASDVPVSSSPTRPARSDERNPSDSNVRETSSSPTTSPLAAKSTEGAKPSSDNSTGTPKEADCPPVFGTFLSLFFGRGDVSLNVPAKTILNDVVAEAKKNERSLIHVTVYSTRTEGAFSAFPSQMWRAVEGYLVSQGIRQDRVRVYLNSVPSQCKLGFLGVSGRADLEVR